MVGIKTTMYYKVFKYVANCSDNMVRIPLVDSVVGQVKDLLGIRHLQIQIKDETFLFGLRDNGGLGYYWIFPKSQDIGFSP